MYCNIFLQKSFFALQNLLKVGISSSNENPSKMMKNAFYVISKALFVLKIINFLSWFFGDIEKTAWLER